MDNGLHADTEQQDTPKRWATVIVLLCLAFMASTGLGFVFGLLLAGG